MFCVCLVLMAHTHCIGPGQGQGLGPGMMHLLYTLRRDRTRDRGWDRGLMGSITIFQSQSLSRSHAVHEPLQLNILNNEKYFYKITFIKMKFYSLF